MNGEKEERTQVVKKGRGSFPLSDLPQRETEPGCHEPEPLAWMEEHNNDCEARDSDEARTGGED